MIRPERQLKSTRNTRKVTSVIDSVSKLTNTILCTLLGFVIWYGKNTVDTIDKLEDNSNKQVVVAKAAEVSNAAEHAAIKAEITSHFGEERRMWDEIKAHKAWIELHGPPEWTSKMLDGIKADLKELTIKLEALNEKVNSSIERNKRSSGSTVND